MPRVAPRLSNFSMFEPRETPKESERARHVCVCVSKGPYVYTDDNMRIVVVVEYFVSNNARDESTLCSYSHAMTPRGGHIVGSDKPFNKITHSEFQDICLRIVQAQWAGRELKEGPLQTCLCSGSHASALRGG